MVRIVRQRGNLDITASTTTLQTNLSNSGNLSFIGNGKEFYDGTSRKESHGCFKIRFLILLLCFTTSAVIYISRNNINIAIIAMVKKSNKNETVVNKVNSTTAAPPESNDVCPSDVDLNATK